MVRKVSMKSKYLQLYGIHLKMVNYKIEKLVKLISNKQMKVGSILCKNSLYKIKIRLKKHLIKSKKMTQSKKSRRPKITMIKLYLI